MAQFDLPLPEITVDDFERAWTRFLLVADAKEWNEQKRVAVLPALLRGSLVDYFLEVGEEEKTTLTKLKAALAERAGLSTDPLEAARKFMNMNQQEKQRVADYATSLRGLFEKAHKDEPLTSPVLLQRFLTGLQPQISRQVLLKGKPANFQEAVKTATDVEFALSFDDSTKTSTEICTVQNQSEVSLQQLQLTVTKLADQVEALQTQLSSGQSTKRVGQFRDPPSRARRRRCFACGKFGHIQRECYLNFKRQLPGWEGADPNQQ